MPRPVERFMTMNEAKTTVRLEDLQEHFSALARADRDGLLKDALRVIEVINGAGLEAVGRTWLTVEVSDSDVFVLLGNSCLWSSVDDERPYIDPCDRCEGSGKDPNPEKYGNGAPEMACLHCGGAGKGGRRGLLFDHVLSELMQYSTELHKTISTVMRLVVDGEKGVE